MIEQLQGTKYRCTGCGSVFHSSQNNDHLKCGDKKEKVVEVKPATIKVSVKTKKSK